MKNIDKKEIADVVGCFMLVGIAILGVILLYRSAIGIELTESQKLIEAADREAYNLQVDVDYMNSMLFYKDQTTGLCFSSTGAYRSIAMTSVDCASLNNPIPFRSK
jgi:hypothetical protein